MDVSQLTMTPKRIKCDKLRAIPVDSMGKRRDARGYMDSQRREDRDQFYDAYLTEIAAFDEKGVIPDFVTSDELVAASITAKPLPMAALFTISYVENGDGSWTLKKYKA